jgi:O-antigen ligase
MVTMAAMFILPLFPLKIKPVLIILFGVGVLLTRLQYKQSIRWSYIFLNGGLFLLYLISLLYTDDLSIGLRKLETGSSLIVFPILCALMPQEVFELFYKKRNRFFWLFIIAVAIVNCGFFFKFYMHYDLLDTVQHFPNIIRSELAGWNIHPIYLSMLVAVALIFSVLIINDAPSLRNLIPLLMIDALLLFFLLIMIKKGPILSLGLVMSLLIALLKNQKLWILYGVGVSIIIGTIIFQPKVNRKFSELFHIQQVDHNSMTSTNIRVSIYNCAVKIVPDSGIFGFGVGDGKKQLLECYDDKAALLASNRYNSHNQYLGILLKVGYFGLACFLIFIVYRLIQSFAARNYIAITLILFYCIVMFSENILERESGVIYFSFFVNLFLLKNSLKTSKSDRNPTSTLDGQ